jgi:CSLREA domain-containing protein
MQIRSIRDRFERFAKVIHVSAPVRRLQMIKSRSFLQLLVSFVLICFWLVYGDASLADGKEYDTMNETHVSAKSANEYLVTKTADTNDGVCNQDCSLREAIIAANSTPGDSLINLPTGMYLLSIVGVNEDLAATGDLDISDNLTLVGSGAATTIIDGGSIDRVIHITVPSAVVSLTGITIQKGGGFFGMDYGAGIVNSGTLTLEQVTVRDNLSNAGTQGIVAGGGIGNMGSLTIVESTISGNTALGGANGGGGIYNGYGAQANIINSTISGNTTGAAGGGIFSYGDLTATNVTISNNGALSGGGLWSYMVVNLKNTIFANSTSGENCRRYNDHAINSLGHNLDSGSSCGFSRPGDISNVDPKLGPLQNNGGPTFTAALLTGSAAIDTGDSNGCPATDQRGVRRPQGAECDIGAFEYTIPNPQLAINYPNGAPGSYFAVSGSNFPPDDQASVSVNGSLFSEIIATDENGNLSFILDTGQADPGWYTVDVSVNPNASVAFLLSQDSPTRPMEGVGTVLDVPEGIALTEILYLPFALK